jgi:predicted nucleic acid-binding protein
VGLIEDLGRGPAALDTVAFIYWIEESEAYVELLASVFSAADEGRIELISSALTLLEVLVLPFRTGNLALASQYEALLTRSRQIRLVEIDRAQLRAAAQLRAVHQVRTPDALQLAAALSTRCTAFVTNDRRLPALPGLPVLQLRDYA